PHWSEADQTLARAIQQEIGAKVVGMRSKVKSIEPPREPIGGGSDDIGDISWNCPTANLWFPANIPNLPGHAWPTAAAMATAIAHKGSTAGAKALALTVIDLLLSPELIKQARAYFDEVQTREIKYQPLINPDDHPAIDLNRDQMEKFAPQLKKFYYDSS